MIETKLMSLGLNEKEIKIYLAIHKYKRIIPSTISYLTKINRTTVYSVLKLLIQKNLVVEEIKDFKKEIVCLPVENLNNLIHREKLELKQKEDTINSVINDINKEKKQEVYIPHIRTISEEHIEGYLYENFEKWNKSALKYDNIWWGFQDSKLPYHYIDWIDHVWKNSPKEIILKLFSDESEIEKNIGDKFERRQIIFSKDLKKIDGTIWIIGDYVINVFLNEKPFYIIDMYNPILAKNLRKTFNALWKKEIKNNKEGN